jgi:hypothetical protein
VNENDKQWFKRGVHFTSAVLQAIGVDLQGDRLVAFLQEVAAGEATMFPSPEEVGQTGALTEAEAEDYRRLLREQRKGAEEINRAYANLTLEAIRQVTG